MTEETDLAPTEAGGEAVQSEEVEQTTEAAEAPESTEGNPEQAEPATEEAEAKAKAEAEEERTTRNQRRRAAKEKAQAELKQAQDDAKKAQDDLAKIKKATESLKRPVEKDFASYDDYQSALATHGALKAMDQRRIAELEEAAKGHFDQVEARKQAQQREEAETMATHLKDGRTKYADFEAAQERAPVYSKEGVSLLAQSDAAADIIYMIGTNPEVSEAYAKMETSGDFFGIARLIGRLEAQVSAPKPKTATDAPDPINPLRGNAKPSLDPTKMTMDQYREWRANGGTY